jgi:hypothetical protein
MRQTSIHGARHSAESLSVALDKYSSRTHLTWLSQKTVGDEDKLLIYLNSALKDLSGTYIFHHVQKQLNFFAQCN